MATKLADVNFSGADLSNSCLFLADVSGAKFDSTTKINSKDLLKACVTLDEHGARRDIDAGNNSDIRQIASRVPLCPTNPNRCDLLSSKNGWGCGEEVAPANLATAAD